MRQNGLGECLGEVYLSLRVAHLSKPSKLITQDSAQTASLTTSIARHNSRFKRQRQNTQLKIIITRTTFCPQRINYEAPKKDQKIEGGTGTIPISEAKWRQRKTLGGQG